ncbi:MAG TPA: hypothetical protein VKB30_10160 [Candidatus Limnocylindrales bacterium]|nr:hypothetical protein [Candidatus Limnocylindrales bacterium]
MEHPVAMAVLAVIAVWTAIRLLRGTDASAARQVAAALVIGGAFIVAILVQETDLVDDAVEGPAAVVVGIVIAVAALLIPLRLRADRPR